MSRSFWIAAILLAFTASPGAADGGMEFVVTSAGIKIPHPEAARLDCAEIDYLLGVIDASNYRGPEPVGPDHPDFNVQIWEEQLAAERHHRCGTEGLGLANDVFRKGFN